MNEKRKNELEERNAGVIRPAKIIRTISTSGHITTWSAEDNDQQENKKNKKEITENVTYDDSR